MQNVHSVEIQLWHLSNRVLSRGKFCPKLPIKYLRPLRNRVDNFMLFESEVEKMISRLFEKNRRNQNSIERVRNSPIMYL